MSTTIGKRMIDGGAVKYHSAGGNGLTRKVASTILRHLGHMAVDKGANMVEGSGYKIAGGKAKHKKHAHVGRPRKVGRPKKR